MRSRARRRYARVSRSCPVTTPQYRPAPHFRPPADLSTAQAFRTTAQAFRTTAQAFRTTAQAFRTPVRWIICLCSGLFACAVAVGGDHHELESWLWDSERADDVGADGPSARGTEGHA